MNLECCSFIMEVPFKHSGVGQTQEVDFSWGWAWLNIEECGFPPHTYLY